MHIYNNTYNVVQSVRKLAKERPRGLWGLPMPEHVVTRRLVPRLAHV